MIIGVQLRMPEYFVEFADLIFRSIWIEQFNLGKPEVVSETLGKAGFNAEKSLYWLLIRRSRSD